MSDTETTLDFTPSHLSMPDESPCDSPIEDLFFRAIQKVVAESAVIDRQFRCPTPLATFFLDFLITVKGRRVGFECDGREFHSARRDTVRDRAIVTAGHTDAIYRIRGSDIVYHLDDALDLIRVRERVVFSWRGHLNLETLAHPEGLREDHEFKATPEFFAGVERTYFERAEDEPAGDRRPTGQSTIVYWTTSKNNPPQRAVRQPFRD